MTMHYVWAGGPSNLDCFCVSFDGGFFHYKFRWWLAGSNARLENCTDHNYAIYKIVLLPGRNNINQHQNYVAHNVWHHGTSIYLIISLGMHLELDYPKT